MLTVDRRSDVMIPPRATASTPSASVISAALVALATLAFRTMAQGRLQNDHYMHLAWAQQILLGDVPGRDFVDPGMPLMYTLSALLQHAWPGPFTEVVLTSAMLALAAGLTYWFVRSLTGSWHLAIVAVLIEVSLRPRLYSYPKILMPALVLTAFLAYARRPTTARLTIVSLCTAIAFLLRYDLGAFAFVSVALGIAILGLQSTKAVIKEWVRYALVTAAALVPYVLFVQSAEGIVENVREGLEFTKGEAHQFLFSWSEFPAFQRVPLFDDVNAAAWLFYGSYGILAVSAGLLLARLRRDRDEMLAAAAVATALLACYGVVILRHPLAARVPDVAAVLAIAGTWSVSALGAPLWRTFAIRPWRSAIATAALACTVALTAVSVWQLGRVEESFERTRLRYGLPKVGERIAALAVAGTAWPWTWYWPGGDPPDALQYLNTCTETGDRVLVTWSAPEYYFFARRGFAAGHALFASSRSFATQRDRLKMLSRIRRERVPIVLVNETNRAQFASAYPELNAYVQEHYAPVAQFTIRDGSLIGIAARRDARALETYGPAASPCRFARGD